MTPPPPPSQHHNHHQHHSYSGGELKKGPWSAAEDAILIDYVRKHGEGNWNELQRNTSLQRCGKSCRLRWTNHLRPNLKKGAFTPEEERLIVNLHSKLGNKWARISSHLPGRTDNEVKNYWNTRVKRRLRHGLPLYPNQSPSISISSPPTPPPPPFPFNPASSSLFPNLLPYPCTSTTTQLPFPTATATPCFQNSPPPWPPSDLGFLLYDDHTNPITTEETVPPQFGSVFEPTPTDKFPLELPSNQFRNQITTTTTHHRLNDAADIVDLAQLNYPNLLLPSPTATSCTNSGLLDSLLLESRYRSANRAIGGSNSSTSTVSLKKEKVEFDQFGYELDECPSHHHGGDVEIVKVEAEEDLGPNSSTMMNEDLSSIFKQPPIPSSSQQTEWCQCCQETAAVVATEEEVDIYYGFDQMPPLTHHHSPPHHQPDWLDDTNGVLSLLGMNPRHKFTSY